jgi:hypothetical protein
MDVGAQLEIHAKQAPDPTHRGRARSGKSRQIESFTQTENGNAIRGYRGLKQQCAVWMNIC